MSAGPCWAGCSVVSFLTLTLTLHHELSAPGWDLSGRFAAAGSLDARGHQGTAMNGSPCAEWAALPAHVQASSR